MGFGLGLSKRVICVSFRLPLKVRLAASSWAGLAVLGWAGLVASLLAADEKIH